MGYLQSYNGAISRGGKKRLFWVEKPVGISRARYYDPMEGRFVSRDPISFVGGDVNLYGYVQNNPINLTDPTGLASWHFDYNKLGERFIHYGKFRFNSAGELVEHTGKVIKDITCEAAKALEWLKKVKPDFFRAAPFLLILPGQEQILNNYNNTGSFTGSDDT